MKFISGHVFWLKMIHTPTKWPCSKETTKRVVSVKAFVVLIFERIVLLAIQEPNGEARP
jgi:hypothetical protein